MDIFRTAILSFGIVMAAMLFLAGLCDVLRRLSTRQARLAVPSTESPVPDGHLAAVLAAAAAEALGRRVRVHRIHVHRGGEVDRWSRAGRMDIMVSHRVGPSR